MMRPLVVVRKLGCQNFHESLQIQTSVARKHLDELNGESVRGVDTLLIVEHDPVYTIGIRTRPYSENDENHLKSLGADFVRTNRGGLITFHGPGQLVAYPIFNLGHFKKSIRWFVSQLEQSIIRMCLRFDIPARTSPDTGVWVGENKLAAIGIHGRKFVTTHGLAINCNTDLQWFSHIIPCGIMDKGVTSLSEVLKREVTIDETLPYFLDSFSEQFECDLVHELK